VTEDTNQITADNLRADFLNATTNWQRWKVLNRALDWAVAASENAEAYRQRSNVRYGERAICSGDQSLSVGDVVTWDGEEEGWIVREIGRGGEAVVILPLGDDWELGQQVVDVRDLLS
jgi:hypothetical protein